MSWNYDPVSEALNFIPIKIPSKKDIVKSILLESDETVEFAVAKILFDKDSILYNDDEENE